MRNITKGTIIRTVVLLAALINQGLTTMGKNPLPWSDTQIEQGASFLLTAGAALVAWWKNNSFTQAALAADERLRQLKEG